MIVVYVCVYEGKTIPPPPTDSYARHFAALFLERFPEKDEISSEFQRPYIESSKLWQGNPISAAKTFATRTCTLCNMERIHIFKQSMTDSTILINSNNEIYGACRHNPKFHRYVSKATSTDESPEDERVMPAKVTTEV